VGFEEFTHPSSGPKLFYLQKPFNLQQHDR